MSYASKKGYEGQYELRDLLNDALEEFGYRFASIGGTERSKKLLAGDVVLLKASDPHNQCLLNDYYLEAKKHASGNVFESLMKAEDDSRYWSKLGAILYFARQAAGKKGERLIAMSPTTFVRIIKHLQGYINAEKHN
jgi:hypothetical protein